MCCGAYDWTMDKIGYTWGAAVELNQKYWAFRVGYFLVPRTSNENRFDTRILKVGEYIGELELRMSPMRVAMRKRLRNPSILPTTLISRSLDKYGPITVS